MHKFFVQREFITEDTAIIEGDDVKHIYKVLRLETGDKVSINDCQGNEYLGDINEINKKQVIVNLLEKLPINNESPVNIHLYQGLPKSTKMDLIVQKATELGVKEVTPVVTERVVVKSELSEFKKVDRWNRIALEACKQSKRSLLPVINTPIEFDELVNNLNNMDLIVVPYENEDGYGIKNIVSDLNKNIKNIAVVIGPEGGFEDREIEILRSINAHIVTLGPRILRTETAGFVCVAMLMYELGDIGGTAYREG
ncbi:16S rRNA (uracil(1498)-N(3))-methyltransferase [Clostridium sp. YIM B02515]|uniref:Ribosomal RNA small subunit methyltransferase E n=1 Tax=Clostridium rhizosphaerae TaxID=2803861 RepID=A0ABS1T746_9CLOT|nr:16S rRNA (uracil(1498)-N(3))-methyltransferase [Clostridium rhizosphaerae]MBL4935174.1 16S rRNA (uracil(1498)-N(3))-methyltransferase [Clostridium rhizosphaerae]